MAFLKNEIGAIYIYIAPISLYLYIERGVCVYRKKGKQKRKREGDREGGRSPDPDNSFQW